MEVIEHVLEHNEHKVFAELERAIGSNDELVLSTDNGLKIIEEYAKKDKRILVWKNGDTYFRIEAEVFSRLRPRNDDY